MKNLVDILEFVSKDTILEKLDINKVNLNEFPIDGSIKDICEYLKKNGYEEVSIKYGINNFYNLSRQTNKAFICDRAKSSWVIFGDLTRPISNHYPSFRILSDKKFYVEWPSSNERLASVPLTKEEFLERINDTLGL